MPPQPTRAAGAAAQGPQARANGEAAIAPTAARSSGYDQLRRVTQEVQNLGRQNLWAAAWDSLQDACRGAVRSDAVLYSAALRPCERATAWQTSLGVLEDLGATALHNDAVLWSSCMGAVGRTEQWRCAELCFASMRCEKIEADAICVNSCLTAFAKAGRWRRAAQELRRCAGLQIPLDAIARNAGLAACDKGAESQAAVRMLEEFREAKMRPDVVSFTAASSACAKDRKMWRMGLDITRQLLACGILPTVVTYNAACTACATGKEWWLPLHLLGEMWSSHSLAPDVGVITASMASCATLDAPLDVALTILDDMLYMGPPPTAFSCSVAIDACLVHGSKDVAEDLCKLMVERGLQLSAFTYSRLLGAADSPSNAGAVMQRMAADAVQADVVVFGTAASRCEAGGYWQQALKWLAECRRSMLQTSVELLGSVASALEKRREWRNALELLNSVAVRGLRSSDILQNAVSSACQKGWQWPIVLELMGSMARTQDLVSLNAALASLDDAAEWQAALRLLLASRRARVQADAVTCASAMQALTGDGESCWRKAFHVSEELAFQRMSLNAVVGGAAISSCRGECCWLGVMSLLRETRRLDDELGDLVAHLAALDAVEADPGPGRLLAASAFRCVLAWTAARTRGHALESKRGKEREGQAAANVVKQGQMIQAVDLLLWHGCADADVTAAAARAVVAFALAELRLEDAQGAQPASLLGRFDRPNMPYCLGAGPTAEACAQLQRTDRGSSGSSPDRGSHGHWLSKARRSARSLTRQELAASASGSLPSTEPATKSLVAWFSCVLAPQRGGAQHRQALGHLVTHDASSAGAGDILRPVFADHDRSSHAERQALLVLLDASRFGQFAPTD
eukprot:TRINITY_DN51448_c0_g3_i1.p1 TRINITY_DN51448_c0_g3~~TRINITY_DN51448_c0_g3_i1.p1  ORF type:complete len:860 (-),score=146.93 TRINITY_DN51448_c0_g3_i1:252-2831(-)